MSSGAACGLASTQGGRSGTRDSLGVDHLVPLADAHRSGGWAWTKERKRRYANSLTQPDHLIAVTAKANRQKADKSPERWKPPRKRSWCRYATSWAKVKRRWALAVTAAEAAALREMLSTCKRRVRLITRPWQHPQPPQEPEEEPGQATTVYQ